MTHASTRGAFSLVRWFAVLAILLTFLSPLGISAQDLAGNASPPPPEATQQVDPTAEPTEVIAPTEAPTEIIQPTAEPTDVIEPTAEPTEPAAATETPTEEIAPSETPTEEAAATETPTATAEATQTPTATPTEQSDFSASGVTDSGFSSASYSGSPGQTIDLQFTITMDTAPAPPAQLTFTAPPLLNFVTASASSLVPDAQCGAAGVNPLTFVVEYGPSPTTASTCTVYIRVQIPAIIPTGAYQVTVSGALIDSTTIQVIEASAPSLSISLSPSTAAVGQEVTVTVTLVDPVQFGLTGVIDVPIPLNTLPVSGSAVATCSVCNVPPNATINPIAAHLDFANLGGPLTVTLTFRVTVAPVATPGSSIAFTATGMASGIPTAPAITTLTVASGPVGEPTLTVSLSDTTPAPGDVITVTVVQSDVSATSPLPGTIDATVPLGMLISLAPAPAISCSPACITSTPPTTGLLNVFGSYTSAPSTATTVTMTFLVTISSFAIEGQVLSFGATGTSVSGVLTTATSVDATVTVGSVGVPTLTISLSDTAPSPGDTITVTVVQTDVSVLAPLLATIDATLPPGVSLAPIPPPAMTCSPACDPPPLATGAYPTVTGSYSELPSTATTVTMTFDVIVSPSAIQGQLLNFYASGTSAGGTPTTAAPAGATVSTNPTSLPLTVSVPSSAEPGQTVSISASVMEPLIPGSQSGSIEITIPDGVTLFPNSGSVGCLGCTSNVTESATHVSATYTPGGVFNLISLNFDVTIDADATVGSTLTFEASGVDSFGSPMSGSTGTLSIAAPGSVATLSIALSAASAAPGDTVGVTITQFDPGTGSGTVSSTPPPSTTLVAGSAEISCTPACTLAPSVIESLLVHGTYITSGPTTITMTYEVTLSTVVPVPTIQFHANGISASAALLNATPVNLTITAAPVALTFTAMPGSAYPGDTITVTVSMPEGLGTGSGTITADLPDGVTLGAALPIPTCGFCIPSFTSDADSVTMNYSQPVPVPAPVGFSFLVAIDADTAAGTVLNFTGSGTTVTGAPGNPVPASVTVLAPLAAPTLNIEVAQGMTFNGDLTETVTGGVAPYTFAESVSSNPTGQLTLNTNGTFAYSNTVLGPDTFRYIVMDNTSGTALTAEGVVNVTVTAAPIVTTPRSITVVSGELISDSVEAQVTGGVSPYSFTVATQPAKGVLELNIDGTFEYTANGSIAGTDQFTYTVTDSQTGGPVNGVVNITITAAPLTIETLIVNVVAGETVSGDLKESVSGGAPPYTFTINLAPGIGELQLNPDGTFTYTAPVGPARMISFTYNVTDTQGAGGSGGSGGSGGWIFEPGEPGGDGGNGGSGGWIFGPGGNGGEGGVGGNGGQAGAGEISAAAIPGGEVQINITAAPIVTTPKTITVVSGEIVTDTVVGQVTGGTPPYSFTITSDPSFGTVSLEDVGSFTYTANAGIAGTDQFTYTVTDNGGGEPVTGVVNITIEAAPLLTSFLALNVVSGEVITGDLSESVSGGVPPYTFTINQAPNLGELTLNQDGTFTFTAPVGVAGTTSFAYTVTDSQVLAGGTGAAATTGGEVQVIITAAALTTTPLELNVDAGASIDGDLTPQVSGGVSPYTFLLVTEPIQGDVTLNSDGTFSYTANDDAEGTDQFIYTVTDSEIQITSEVGGAATATGVVDIIIAAPTPTPTETPVPTVTPTLEPGITPTATDPAVTVVPGDPTKEPTREPTKSGVTELPSTGQGVGGGSSMGLLLALLTAGILLLVVAATRLRRR